MEISPSPQELGFHKTLRIQTGSPLIDKPRTAKHDMVDLATT